MKNAASLATFASLALAGIVLAYWTWVWFAPAPSPRAPSAVETASQSSAAGALFGTAKSTAAGASSGNLRLMGVVAAGGENRGHAVLRLDNRKTVAVLQGAEVEPGLRLAEVHADHVVLERNGARESLAWPEKSSK